MPACLQSLKLINQLSETGDSECKQTRRQHSCVHELLRDVDMTL